MVRVVQGERGCGTQSGLWNISTIVGGSGMGSGDSEVAGDDACRGVTTMVSETLKDIVAMLETIYWMTGMIGGGCSLQIQNVLLL